MAWIIVLDAGPVSLASQSRNKPDAARCHAWIRTMDAAGARIVVPEIADYEVRRELIRSGATTGIGRLDQVGSALEYDPITTPAMRRAAEFWAFLRQSGIPTADQHALDADCILAAQASLLGGPGDMVTIATINARHLSRFPGVDAQQWDAIVP